MARNDPAYDLGVLEGRRHVLDRLDRLLSSLATETYDTLPYQQQVAQGMRALLEIVRFIRQEYRETP